MDLAHLHPAFVHFPISLSIVATSFLGWGLWKKSAFAVRAGLVLLCTAGVLAVPAYITGQVARAVLEDSPLFAVAGLLADRHEDLGLASLAALIALGAMSGVLLWKDPEGKERPWGLWALALASTLLVCATAWVGGRLVFELGVGVSRG